MYKVLHNEKINLGLFYDYSSFLKNLTTIIFILVNNINNFFSNLLAFKLVHFHRLTFTLTFHSL
jgi:hypothetical protein